MHSEIAAAIESAQSCSIKLNPLPILNNRYLDEIWRVICINVHSLRVLIPYHHIMSFVYMNYDDIYIWSDK